MKKIISILIVIMLIGIFGCSTAKKNTGKAASNTSLNQGKEVKQESDKKTPTPDTVTEEQKKNPLPQGSNSYTGKIKKIEDGKITLVVQGTEMQITYDKGTNFQKGSTPRSGKVEDLQPELKVNVLVMNGKAMSIHYE